MTPEELLSWMEKCPVCGKVLEINYGGYTKFCMDHGYFVVPLPNTIVFVLNPDAKAE